MQCDDPSIAEYLPSFLLLTLIVLESSFSFMTETSLLSQDRLPILQVTVATKNWRNNKFAVYRLEQIADVTVRLGGYDCSIYSLPRKLCGLLMAVMHIQILELQCVDY
jgi:hypothetical protein